MISITLRNIKTYLHLGSISVNMVYPKRKDAHFRVEQPLMIELSTGLKIKIPKNFEFDGSSSPQILWWLFPSYGDFFFAALIHDFLYVTQYKHNELGMKDAQKLADKEMFIWSNVLNDNKIDNYLRYKAVRLFGRKIYRK